MIYWVDTVGLDPLQLVLLGTALEAAVFIAEIPTGVVADTRSRKLSLVVSHVVVGAGVMLTGLTSSFWILMGAQVLWGVGWTFKSGADVAWITDELDDEVASDMAIARAGQWAQIGSIVGVVIAGVLALATSYEVVIVLCGALTMVLGVGVAVLFTEHAFEPAQGDTWPAAVAVLKQGITLIRTQRVILGVFLAMFLIDMGAEALDRLAVKRFGDLGFPDTADPIVWLMLLNVSAFALSAVFLKIIASRLEPEGAPRRFFGMGIALAILSALLLAAAPSIAYGMAGALLFRSVSSSVFPVVGAVWVNRRATSDVRATLQSFLGQAGSFGEIAGGLLLGGVAQWLNLPLAFTGSAVLFCVALLVVLRNRPPSADDAAIHVA